MAVRSTWRSKGSSSSSAGGRARRSEIRPMSSSVPRRPQFHDRHQPHVGVGVGLAQPAANGLEFLAERRHGRRMETAAGRPFASPPAGSAIRSTTARTRCSASSRVWISSAGSLCPDASGPRLRRRSKQTLPRAGSGPAGRLRAGLPAVLPQQKVQQPQFRRTEVGRTVRRVRPAGLACACQSSYNVGAAGLAVMVGI